MELLTGKERRVLIARVKELRQEQADSNDGVEYNKKEAARLGDEIDTLLHLIERDALARDESEGSS